MLAVYALGAGLPAYAQTSPAWSAPSGESCAPGQTTYVACVAELQKARQQVATALDSERDPARRTQLEREVEQLGAASDAFTDLEQRLVKIAQLKAAVAAAEERRESASDRHLVDAYEQLRIAEFTGELSRLDNTLAVVRAGAGEYLAIAKGEAAGLTHASSPRLDRQKPGGDCAEMISNPDVGLDVSKCKNVAITQSVAAVPGGSVKVPGSVLDPPGFSAVLSAAETGGSVSLTLAREFKRRRVPDARERELADTEDVQRAWSWGASFGLRAGEGNLFTRDDRIPDFDQIDAKAALVASLSFNVHSAETHAEWRARAEKLAADAAKACLTDQRAEEPSFRSTCLGGALTEWVYAVDPVKNKLRHPEIAKQADGLYFGHKNKFPLFGGGVAAEIGRSSYEYLLPSSFDSFFRTEEGFNDAFKAAAVRREGYWTASLSPYLYLRLTEASAKLGVSLIPSYTIATSWGYRPGTEKALFCPNNPSGETFNTQDCARYFGSRPTFSEVQTFASELRSFFPFFGGVDMIFSPKLSWNDRDRTKNHPWQLSVPLLAFIDESQTSAVGLKLDWGFGMVPADGSDTDGAVQLKLIYQSTFSLTPK